jgi:NAD(P)H-hydrate epimerase
METEAFVTADARPVPAVTATEMRDVDRVAVDRFGIEVLQMMEHAGRALAHVVRERTDGPVTVLAGNGGNGGGGLCCARHLRNRGVDLRVVLDRAPDDLSGPAAHHHATLREMGVPVAVGSEGLDPDAGSVVDALVGYGLGGPLRGTAAELVAAIPDTTTVISLDVPSGMDATTGERPGVAVDAHSVVTLALPKTGLTGAEGDLLLADIGLPAGVYDVLDIPPFAFDDYLVRVTSP